MVKISDFFKLEKYKDAQPHHHHISLLIVGKILMVIALIILIKPAFTGFTISRQFEKLNISPDDAIRKQEALSLQIGGLEGRLESCKEDQKVIKEQMNSEVSSRTECLKSKGEIEAELDRAKRDFQLQLDSNEKRMEDEKSGIEAELDMEKSKSADAEKNFNELALNSANNICCKVRVDDKAIDSYKIADNKVVCGKGEASAINC